MPSKRPIDTAVVDDNVVVRGEAGEKADTETAEKAPNATSCWMIFMMIWYWKNEIRLYVVVTKTLLWLFDQSQKNISAWSAQDFACHGDCWRFDVDTATVRWKKWKVYMYNQDTCLTYIYVWAWGVVIIHGVKRDPSLPRQQLLKIYRNQGLVFLLWKTSCNLFTGARNEKNDSKEPHSWSFFLEVFFSCRGCWLCVGEPCPSPSVTTIWREACRNQSKTL